MKYTNIERAFLVKNYIKKQNIALVQSAWRTHFKVKSAPSRAVILYYNAKFNKSGSVIHIPLKVPKISLKRLNAKNCLKILIEEDSALSLRKLSSAANISLGMTQSILRKDLMLKPYKYQEAHLLMATDYEKRVLFAKWINSLPERNIEFMIFRDKAYFYLTESVNKQNNRL